MSSVSILLGPCANYSYFDTCRRQCASSVSACNWASYCTFNVMVLKCTRITINVSQTWHTIVSQLGFKLDSLVWLEH